MQTGIQFSEVQSLYELCTFSTDLKKFCNDIGVNYEKYQKWQSRQRWSDDEQKTIEVDLPAENVMSEVEVTGAPVEDSCDEDEIQCDETDIEDSSSEDVQQQLIKEHSSTSPLGTPEIKGFDLRKTTLADVICAGRGLDMKIESFKLHMHDGLHMRHTHITLREAIIILHQLNIMYSC